MFSGIFVPKVWFFRCRRRDLRKMNIYMSAEADELYGKVCGIVISDDAPLVRAAALQSLYDGLGKASEMLDDVLYGRLGMSCEDVVEVLIDEDNRKSCQKHVPFY